LASDECWCVKDQEAKANINRQRLKKQSKKDKAKIPQEKTPRPVPAEEFDEKPHDYGGIPARDLKKNLGCG
jgi:hypothetical protein